MLSSEVFYLTTLYNKRSKF